MITQSVPETNLQNLSIDTQQITTFADDVDTDTYTKPMPSSNMQWVKLGDDDKTHSVLSILQRPVVVARGEFVTTFTSLSLKFPDVIFSNSTNVVSKLDYFAYFRANVRIRLLFNATPFMNGRYWMFFAPFDSVSNRAALVATTDGNVLPNCTGFPGVEIDLASNAPVEIEIPYCAPLSHYNLVNSFSNMGEFYLIPLNPIQTGTAPVGAGSGATFTLMAWFTNIDLAMPTSGTTLVPTTLVAQIGTSEEENTSGISVASVADAVATTATVLSGVPVLGNIARPIAWVSRAAAGVASTFGWNKPDSMAPVAPYVNVPAKGYTNIDGIDISTKLGGMPDNGLAYGPGMFSTDVDEMAISHVASKSCIYAHNVDWNLVQAATTRLHFAPVAPGVSGGDANTIYPTTLAYLCSLFKYWRGGLKYRITIAKTAFHTGRLRITYHAGVKDITEITTPENAYNWVLDLSTSSELEFTIPYVSNVPWKEVVVSEFNQSKFAPEFSKTGILDIQVLTSLRRASDSVADNCPINIWISADTDFALSIPDGGDFGVTIPIALLEAQIFNRTDPAIAHNEQVDHSASEFFPASSMPFTGPEELTIGEKMTSLRQVIKRFCPIAIAHPYPYKLETNAGAVFPGPIDLSTNEYLYNQITLDPAYFGMVDDYSNPDLLVLPESRQSDGIIHTNAFNAMTRFRASHPFYRISYLYRFFRGGTRYKIVNPPTNNIQVRSSGWRLADNDALSTVYTNSLDSVNTGDLRPQLPLFAVRDNSIIENGLVAEPAVGTFFEYGNLNQFEHYVYPDLNGTLEVEVPYYGQTPISVVCEKTTSSVDGPLVRRSKIHLRRSHDPFGMDTFIYQYTDVAVNPVSGWTTTAPSTRSGGLRQCIGGAVIYQAAADDFSFGYLVGAPPLVKLTFN